MPSRLRNQRVDSLFQIGILCDGGNKTSKEDDLCHYYHQYLAVLAANSVMLTLRDQTNYILEAKNNQSSLDRAEIVIDSYLAMIRSMEFVGFKFVANYEHPKKAALESVVKKEMTSFKETVGFIYISVLKECSLYNYGIEKENPEKVKKIIEKIETKENEESENKLTDCEALFKRVRALRASLDNESENAKRKFEEVKCTA